MKAGPVGSSITFWRSYACDVRRAVASFLGVLALSACGGDHQVFGDAPCDVLVKIEGTCFSSVDVSGCDVVFSGASRDSKQAEQDCLASTAQAPSEGFLVIPFASSGGTATCHVAVGLEGLATGKSFDVSFSNCSPAGPSIIDLGSSDAGTPAFVADAASD